MRNRALLPGGRRNAKDRGDIVMNETGNREMTERATTEACVFAGAREFTVGGVLGRTFSTLRANPLVFCGITASFFLPSLLAKGLIDDPVASQLISAILNLTLLQIMQGAMAYAAYQILKCKSASFGAAMDRGTRRIFAMIAISWLTGLGIGLGAFVLVLLPIRIFGRLGLLVSVVLVLTAGMALLCSIPVMIPACVVEGLGPIESINRGAALTKGYRWKIFALYLFAFVCVVVSLPLSAFISRLVPLGGIVRLLVMGIILVFPLTFCFAMGPVAYYGLREAKEGVSIESMANVFD